METIEHESQQPAPTETKAVARADDARPKQVSEGMAMLAMIERVALDPNVDVAKMQAIVNMKIQLEDRQAVAEFNAAMARVQKKIESIAKTKYNKHTKSWYGDLGAIITAIKPVYTADGFALSFGTLPGAPAGHIKVSCEVSHRGGHSKTYEADIALDTSGSQGNSNKTAVQGWGSSASYARRYIQVMIFNLALEGEDNDGNGGEEGEGGGRRKVRSVSDVYPQDGQAQKTESSSPAKEPSKPAQTHVNANQIKLLRNKMATAGKSEVDLLKRFEIKKIEDLRFPNDLNGAFEWISE